MIFHLILARFSPNFHLISSFFSPKITCWQWLKSETHVHWTSTVRCKEVTSSILNNGLVWSLSISICFHKNWDGNVTYLHFHSSHMACNTWFLDCHQAMLPQSSCNSCNLYLHLFIDTCNPNLNIDLLLTVIVTGWISWSLIWTNYLFWKIEEKEYLKRTSLWDLLICHIVSCQTECRLITFYYFRLNVPAYNNMVISGHFDQRWILAGVPGATECQPGWCHSQLCRSQRSVTLNSSSSSSCSNTLFGTSCKSSIWTFLTPGLGSGWVLFSDWSGCNKGQKVFGWLLDFGQVSMPSEGWSEPG